MQYVLELKKYLILIPSLFLGAFNVACTADLATVAAKLPSEIESKNITIQFEDIVISENENKFIMLELDKAADEDINLEWEITGDEASSHFQFTQGTVAILKGATEVPVSIKSLDDEVYNPDMSFNIALSELGDSNSKLKLMPQDFTLNNNDSKPTLSFSATSSTVAEGDGSISLPVQIDRVSSKDIQLSYSIVAGSSSTDENDVSLSGTHSISAGQTSSNILIDVLDDETVESDELVVIRLDSVSIDSSDFLEIDAAAKDYSLTIEDNEVVCSNSPNISVVNSSVAEGEIGTVTISLDTYHCSNNIEVNYQITDGSATIENSDYSATVFSGTLSIAAGDTTASLTITTTDDSVFENNETINISLDSPTNAVLSKASGTLTITNNDTSDYIWTGAGATNNWSEAENWSGGVVPTSSDIVYFNASCSSNCNPVISAGADVLGIKVLSGYSGTISQAASQEITIGTEGFYLESGSFIGSDGPITIEGHLKIENASFTSTSGLLKFAGSAFEAARTEGLELASTGSFIHNSGTLEFAGSVAENCNTDRAGNTISLEKDLSLNNVTVTIDDSKGSGCSSSNKYNDVFLQLPSTNKVLVNGHMVLNDGYLKDGNMELFDSLTLNCSGGDSYSSRTCFGGGDSNLILKNGFSSSITAQDGAIFPKLVVDTESTNVTVAGPSTQTNISSLEILSGSFSTSTSILKLGTYGSGTTASHFRVASGASFSSTGTVILRPSYYLRCGGDVIGMELGLEGTVSLNNLTIDVYDSNASTSSCGKGGNQLILNNISSNPITVGGDFTFIDGKINGGEFIIAGNFDAQCAGGAGPIDSLVCAGGGTTNLRFNGSSSQTIRMDATALIPGSNIYFNNASGFVLTTEMTFNSHNLFMQNGDIDLAGFNFLGLADVSEYSSSIVPTASETIEYTSCLGGPVGSPCP